MRDTAQRDYWFNEWSEEFERNTQLQGEVILLKAWVGGLLAALFLSMVYIFST